MAEAKNNRIKVYIVIGLAVVLAISVYFRFVHGKVAAHTSQGSSEATFVQLDVPQVSTEDPQNAQRRESFVHEYLHTAIRDLFSPLNSPLNQQSPSEEQGLREPSPSLKLKGTIVGGKKPIAIINDQFVRMGDRIGEYRVVRIGKKEVLLDSGNGRVVLEILKND
jgi:hypothetical protein